MVKVLTDDLPKEREARIRQWLVKPEAGEFLDLVSGKARAHMADAMNSAFQASESNSKIDLANQHLIAAKQHERFVEIFIEFASSTKPFKTVKLS